MVETSADPYSAVRGYVENGGAVGWKHKEAAQDLYSMGDVFRTYLFSPKNPGDYEMPPVLVGVEPMRYQTLAAYYLVENPVGLKYQISLNSLYIDRPKWELYETLAHEMLHLYQENHPDLPSCKGGYHNTNFIELAEEIGLHPALGTGCHLKPADGQFERLMERYGVNRPGYAKELPPPDLDGKWKYWWDDNRGKKKGASTLLKYVCDCNPPYNIRTGRKDLMALCLICNGVFKLEKGTD